MNAFESAFYETIGFEGGYVNDPADPGGETKYGISKRSLVSKLKSISSENKYYTHNTQQHPPQQKK